ncbi:MAG: exonuclease SbcCD subunit D [Ruminococcus sp.]|nr:exonuclease SbcCD subunit D [Ruminococcus sp.]
MKFLHISDLHLGRKIYNVSLLSDQEYLLGQILSIIGKEKIDTIFISGDIYDKHVPNTEAVICFDSFLTNLVEMNVEIFIIGGNHDSPERIQFGSRLLEKSKIHISGIFQGVLNKSVLHDEYGAVNVYMLPFVKNTIAAFKMNHKSFSDTEEFIKTLFSKENIDERERNILLYHGFVINGNRIEDLERSDSELQVGGIDYVNANVFKSFDYVALGHIHAPQWVKKSSVRYSGSLMKYSFSEANQKKSVTIGEIKEKGNIEFKTISLDVKRDMRIISGPFEEIKKYAEKTDDFIQIGLTDENIISYAVEQLREFYPNLLELIYLKKQNNENISDLIEIQDVEKKDKFDLLKEFYESVYEYDLSEDNELYKIMKNICEKAEEEGVL